MLVSLYDNGAPIWTGSLAEFQANNPDEPVDVNALNEGVIVGGGAHGDFVLKATALQPVPMY